MRTNLAITQTAAISDGVDREQELERLVYRFYERAREDTVLGPIFDANVGDWDAHLATMRRFWSSAIYRTGEYSGRPLDVHRAIPELRSEHFPRWLALWRATVDEVVTSEAKGPLVRLAERMAETIGGRLRSASDDLKDA